VIIQIPIIGPILPCPENELKILRRIGLLSKKDITFTRGVGITSEIFRTFIEVKRSSRSSFLWFRVKIQII